MGLETGTYIDDLVVTNPESTDKRRFGDDHFRLVKRVLKNTFPNADGAINPAVAEFNYLVGVTSDIQTQIDDKVDPVDIEDMAEVDVQNTFTQGQATEEVEVTFAVTLVLDASLSNAFKVTVTDDFTLDIPTNGILGQVLTLFILQDLFGSRIITYDGEFRGSTTDDLVLSTGASKLDLMTLIYGGPTDRWFVASLKKDIHNAI